MQYIKYLEGKTQIVRHKALLAVTDLDYCGRPSILVAVQSGCLIDHAGEYSYDFALEQASSEGTPRRISLMRTHTK